MAGRRLTETKPFFLTSELAVVAAALTALAVTAASSDSLDAGLLWLLATAIVVGFVFSRGFAKTNAASHAFDPRETFRLRGGGGSRGGGSNDEEETQQMSTIREDEYATQRPMGRPMYGYRGGMMREHFPIETKPFFLTSEFWASVALIAGLAIAAGTSEDIDARLFWILATAITIGYVISRGIAKSGTKSRSWDPREDLMQGMRERAGSRGD